MNKTDEELLKEDITNVLQHTKEVVKMAKQILDSNHLAIYHLKDTVLHLEDALECLEKNYTINDRYAL